MRRKKTFVALVAGLLLLGFVSISFGTPAFYTCRIAYVGSTTTRPTIQLLSVDGRVDYRMVFDLGGEGERDAGDCFDGV